MARVFREQTMEKTAGKIPAVWYNIYSKAGELHPPRIPVKKAP
jgi:hypothetical protein